LCAGLLLFLSLGPVSLSNPQPLVFVNFISPKVGIWMPGILALFYTLVDLYRTLNGHPTWSSSMATNSVPLLIIFVNATTARYVNQLEARLSALEKGR
jgi:hypothetical protein